MSIMDVFGRGAMPQFNMRGAGTSTPFRDLGTEALRTQAAGEELRALQEEKFSSDMGKVSDGLDYLKELMSPEDQEEELLEDLPLEAITPIMGPSGDDEATGKFTPSYDVEPTFTQKAVEGGKNIFQKGVDFVKNNPIESALTAGSFFNLPLAAIMGGYYLGKENPIPSAEDAVEYGNFEEGNLGVAMDKSGFFDQGSIQRQRELNDALEDPNADLPSWYDEMDHEGSMAGAYDTREFAYGGRVGFEEGGGLFERTSQIPEMFTTDELPSDPLSQIVKMGMAVRAPLLDVVEMLGLGAKESARVVSDLVKKGYDVTEPLRDVAGDAIADTAEFIQKDARDMGRFMSPTYYADRFIVPALRGEEARTDTETRLRKDLSNRGRSSATQERTEMLKQKLFEETFGKDTQGRSALARPVEIDLGDGISVDYADGGRVGLNTGGMPFGYTPFMNMQQGIDYYSQFANPTYGNAVVEESQQQDQSSVADDVLGQEENLGTLIDPRGGRGPEDRGSFADRFGTAEDQGYGYSGTPGEGGSGTFKNPAFGDYGDTFTPGPGIGMAYDEYGRLQNIGVLNDLGLNLYDAAYPIAKMKPGIPGIVENIFNANKNYQEKKAKEEQEAKQKQVQEDAVALSNEIKDQFASYNVGGGDKKNKPSTGTGTFSGGTVSGFTGQGQSPHSSMSTAGKNKNTNKNKNKNKNDGVGGGAGPKGGTGSPGDTGRQGRSRCFVKGTMVEMADGTTKEITTITPGMETRGGTVEFVLQGLPVDIWDYKGVKVSGTHWVVEDNQLIAVEDSKHGIKTDMFEPVYSMKTSKQRMWVKGIEFGDFESGTDEDWEPYFEKVRQDLNKKLHEKRKENQQSDERV